MRLRIWALATLLPVLNVLAQQRPLPTPPQFQQRFNRDQLNGLSSSEESSLALPQPPLFMTSPSFSFDDVPPTTTTPTSRSLTVSPTTSFRHSTRPSRPRRPFVRPVESVHLQQFRPTPRTHQLPIRPRFRTTTSQLRPTTQPPLRRIQLNNPAQARPRFQPAPPAAPRRPATVPQRAPPIQVQPASVSPPVRRPSPTPALQIRPLTQPAAPRAQPFSRTPPQSRPPPPVAFTPGIRNRPSVPRPSQQPLPPPLTVSHSTAPTSVRRPVPPSTPSFASTNSIGPSGPPNTRPSVRPSTPRSAHPPGNMPPNNFVVDELNRADDFMAVAARLKLRRFARHRNRRRADFILQQQLKNR